jgi:zinc protease
LATAFGGLPRTAPAPIPGVREVGAIGVHVIAMPVPQPNVLFGMTGMLRTDPDFIPAYVANYILGGGGFSSRLTDEVREKRGLTYGVSTGLEPMHRAGLVLGQVASKRESVRQAVQVIRDTMKEFAANGPTDKELADAKTYLTGSFPLAFDSNGGIADQLSVFQRENLPIDYIDKRNDLINAVTADDVQRAARRLYNPAKMTIVIAGSLGPQKPVPPIAPAPKSKPKRKPAAAKSHP